MPNSSAKVCFLWTAGAKLKKTRKKTIALHARPQSMRCGGGRCRLSSLVSDYMGYWNPFAVRWYARTDLGYAKFSDEQVRMLEKEKFGFQTVKDIPGQPHSLLQRYFLEPCRIISF